MVFVKSIESDNGQLEMSHSQNGNGWSLEWDAKDPIIRPQRRFAITRVPSRYSIQQHVFYLDFSDSDFDDQLMSDEMMHRSLVPVWRMDTVGFGRIVRNQRMCQDCPSLWDWKWIVFVS